MTTRQTAINKVLDTIQKAREEDRAAEVARRAAVAENLMDDIKNDISWDDLLPGITQSEPSNKVVLNSSLPPLLDRYKEEYTLLTHETSPDGKGFRESEIGFDFPLLFDWHEDGHDETSFHKMAFLESSTDFDSPPLFDVYNDEEEDFIPDLHVFDESMTVEEHEEIQELERSDRNRRVQRCKSTMKKADSCVAITSSLLCVFPALTFTATSIPEATKMERGVTLTNELVAASLEELYDEESTNKSSEELYNAMNDGWKVQVFAIEKSAISILAERLVSLDAHKVFAEMSGRDVKTCCSLRYAFDPGINYASTSKVLGTRMDTYIEIVDGCNNTNYTTNRSEQRVFDPIDMNDVAEVKCGGLLRWVAVTHYILKPITTPVMKILCNHEIYTYALTELRLDSPNPPLENFLLKFIRVLKTTKESGQKDEAIWIDFSNKWFSLTSSTRPSVYGYFQELRNNVAVLASHLIGGVMIGSILDGPLSDYYQNLGYSISVFETNSRDNTMILVYLQQIYAAEVMFSVIGFCLAIVVLYIVINVSKLYYGADHGGNGGDACYTCNFIDDNTVIANSASPCEFGCGSAHVGEEDGAEAVAVSADVRMLGQFLVSSYSTYLVSDMVIVTIQLPQFPFDVGFSCNRRLIGIPQPRRMASITVAKRVGHDSIGIDRIVKQTFIGMMWEVTEIVMATKSQRTYDKEYFLICFFWYQTCLIKLVASFGVDVDGHIIMVYAVRFYNNGLTQWCSWWSSYFGRVRQCVGPVLLGREQWGSCWSSYTQAPVYATYSCFKIRGRVSLKIGGMMHDHRIILKEGTQMVSVRPYHYPCFQQEEIEKTIRELLNTLHEAIATLETESKCEDSKEKHILENFHSSLVIRKLVMDCPTLAATLWNLDLEGQCLLWSLGHSCKVISAYLESMHPEVQKLAKNELQPKMELSVGNKACVNFHFPFLFVVSDDEEQDFYFVLPVFSGLADVQKIQVLIIEKYANHVTMGPISNGQEVSSIDDESFKRIVFDRGRSNNCDNLEDKVNLRGMDCNVLKRSD